MLGIENATKDDYSSAKRDCEIVMKGGLTSGAVYPKALSEIAKTYKYVNIGGTSSGALA